MPPVPIEAIDDQSFPGDLKAQVRDGKLLLPKAFAEGLQRDGIRTAEDLLSYIHAFPSSVAAALDWTAADVGKAANALRETLKGHVAENHLYPPTRSRPPLGARDPDELK